MPSVRASRTWRAGRVVDEDVRPDEIPRAIRDPGSLVWIDLLRPSEAELTRLVLALGIAPTAVEDALGPRERAKLVARDRFAFFVVYVPSISGERPGRGRRRHSVRLSRVSAIATASALVTIRLDDAVDMAPVEATWSADPHLNEHGVGALVHGLLDDVVDLQFDVIQELEEASDALESRLFSARPPGRAFTRDTFRMRTDLTLLRRVLLPMRDIVGDVRRHPLVAGQDLEPQWADLADHVLRAAEWSESLREDLTAMFEAHLSLQDARLNNITKKLAAWAAIIAVPTLITSWFGQNLGFPLYGTPGGAFISLALIVLATVVLYLTFRHQDWL